jgi:hypothetical protein
VSKWLPERTGSLAVCEVCASARWVDDLWVSNDYAIVDRRVNYALAASFDEQKRQRQRWLSRRDRTPHALWMLLAALAVTRQHSTQSRQNLRHARDAL